MRRGAPAKGGRLDTLNRRLPDQGKELIDRHFYTGDRERDNPKNDHNKADQVPIVRPVLLVMDKSHWFPPRTGLTPV